MTSDRQWQVTWETGPDAGESWFAAPGRHVVGRARQAEIRCDDSALEAFHVQLDLDGPAPTVRQLAGRLPVRSRAADGADPWQLHLGTSTLSVRQVSAGTQHDRRSDQPGSVVRMPRHVERWAPEAVRLEAEPPRPAEPSITLVPALAGLVATVVMAVVVRQMMFVMFGAVGTMVAVSTWVVGRLSHRRRTREHCVASAAEQRRVTSELQRQRDQWVGHIRRTVSTLPKSVATIASGVGLWQRRPSDGDAWCVSLGIGTVAWSPAIDDPVEIEASRLGRVEPVDDLPVAVDLGPRARLAISGPHAVALTNSLVLQLSAQTGPADWQLVVVTATPDQWRWTRDLPHARDALGHPVVVDEAALLELVRDGGLSGRHTVVVTDQAAMLSVRTSAVRRLESVHDSLALIVVHHGAPPALCRASVVTMSDGRARAVADLSVDPHPVVLRFVGVAAASAERSTRQLRDRRDPEDERLNGLDIPATVGLSALLAEAGIDVADSASIAAAWGRAGNDPAPSAPIGRASDGVVEIDLVRDGPHALLAGTTGAGKSELLRSLVIGLSCVLGPHHLTFVLVDYKGGAAFDELGALPHVVGTVTDLDHQLAERALRSLRAELTVREHLLRDHAVGDLTALRTKAGAPVVPRILVVVDEFAALATEQAEFLHALVGIAQRGRSLGVHLLLATQRPSGVISDDIRANTNLRMALRLHDTTDAIDVVGDAAPASLPRGLPGRAVMRLGPDELVTFQTAHSTQVVAVVAAIRAAAEIADLDPPRRVWCDPLPERIEHAELTELHPLAIGLMDLPDQQSQAVFTWSPSDGSVLVVGSSGSGVTSTLITLATSNLAGPVAPTRFDASAPTSGELLVIDAGNDPHWDAVAGHPRCAGVVRLHERERLWRLLDRVANHVAGDPNEPHAFGSTIPTTRLVIDGLGALRHELDAVERATELELLDRIIASGCAVLLVGSDRVAAVPPSLSARCAVRLVHHLHDAQDAAVLGVASSLVPSRIAGRAVVGRSGAVMQLVAPRPLAAVGGGRRRRVPVVGTLPVDVAVADLPASTHHDGRWRVPIGVGFDLLQPSVLEVGDGEHVLVAGPARSGRSTTLSMLCLAWLASHPQAHVHVLAGRRSPLPGWLSPTVASGQVDIGADLESSLDEIQAAISTGRRVLLAVDDAELFDDLTGRLTAMIAGRATGLMVVAAGRPDALRQSYGHWTLAVRRSRLGLLSSGAQDIDGDLLGAALPRRQLLIPRPGLVHLIDGGAVALVQLARPDLDAVPGQVSARVS